MRKRVLFIALGLAAALIAYGQTSAKADHCYSGYGGGYGGYYSGVSVYRAAPIYSYSGYGGHGGYYGGHDHHHSYYRGHGHYGHGHYGHGHYGHGHYGHGRSIQVRSPGFSFGLYR